MPEAAKYRDRPYNRYGAIRRAVDTFNRRGERVTRLQGDYTRDQFERNIQSSTMRAGNRNQQSQITQRNFRQRGGNRTFG